MKKQFPPTPARLKKLREKGQFPQSKRSVHWVFYVVSMSVLCLVVRWGHEPLLLWAKSCYMGRCRTPAAVWVYAALPLCAASFSCCCVRWVYANREFVKKWQGLSFAMFNGEQIAGNLKKKAKDLMVSSLLLPVMGVVTLAGGGYLIAISFGVEVWTSITMVVVFATLVPAPFAVIDYVLEQRRFVAENSMDASELKEEFKDTNGNPQSKQMVRGEMGVGD